MFSKTYLIKRAFIIAVKHLASLIIQKAVQNSLELYQQNHTMVRHIQLN